MERSERRFWAVKRIGRWHSLLFWQFADPRGLDGWLDQLFQVLKTLRSKRTVSANARSVASGSKRGPSSRVKAGSAGYRSVLQRTPERPGARRIAWRPPP